MSDVLAATRAKLVSEATVTALVASRVYYDALPQSATLPAIVLELTGSSVADRYLTATGSLYRSTINIICYGSTRTTATALGEAVHAVIEFDKDTWGTVSVSRSLVDGTYDMVESPRDGSAAWRFVRTLSAVVWHA